MACKFAVRDPCTILYRICTVLGEGDCSRWSVNTRQVKTLALVLYATNIIQLKILNNVKKPKMAGEEKCMTILFYINMIEKSSS